MRIDHTSIWVADLDETEATYEDILNLEETWRNEYDDGTIEAFVRGAGGQPLQLMYRPGTEVQPEPENFRHITVAVDDLSETLPLIRGRDDCELISEQTESAVFTDRDGYRFRITEEAN